MTSGADMTRTTDPESTFGALKPAALDGLAQDGYDRRREADLARMTATRQGKVVPLRSRRRPLLVVAGVAAASVAAAGVVVTTTGGQEGHSGGRPPTAGAQVLDARTFLLAAAESAQKAPAKAGRYWYTRERTTRPVGEVLDKSGAMVKGQKRVRKSVKLPFTATVAGTEDSWYPHDRHDPSRTEMIIDGKVTFSAPGDKAKWQKMGSPDLLTEVFGTNSHHVNNYPGLTTAEIKAAYAHNRVEASPETLPTDATALEAELRRRWKADVHDSKYPLQDGFTQSVFGLAQGLLVGPIQPGTRAALYRVLAKQPGVRLGGRATDQTGRPGMAVDLPSGKGGPTIRLIIDPATGQLFAQESYEQRATGTPVLSIVYLSTGWVNKLGARLGS
ncbi:MAG: hypothetical protein JWN52_408 [Actinomycetia bacterium]|nr:hypothetical protein [Actinomycetes bacterium]